MVLAGSVGIEPAGRAVPRARAGQRRELGVPARVQARGAGRLPRPQPPAMHLIDNEGFRLAELPCRDRVVATRGAVTRAST